MTINVSPVTIIIHNNRRYILLIYNRAPTSLTVEQFHSHIINNHVVLQFQVSASRNWSRNFHKNFLWQYIMYFIKLQSHIHL